MGHPHSLNLFSPNHNRLAPRWQSLRLPLQTGNPRGWNAAASGRRRRACCPSSPADIENISLAAELNKPFLSCSEHDSTCHDGGKKKSQGMWRHWGFDEGLRRPLNRSSSRPWSEGCWRPSLCSLATCCPWTSSPADFGDFCDLGEAWDVEGASLQQVSWSRTRHEKACFF